MTEVSPEQVMDIDTPAGLPAASLIICSRNRPQLLTETVASVLQGEHVPAEIVVIDQSDKRHPSLGTMPANHGCEIRYLWTHSVGLGRARNAGIAAARHDILAVTDDDMLAVPTWFGALIRALLDAGPKSVVTGQVRPAATEVPGGFVPSTKIDEVPAVYEGRTDRDVLYMGNMAMYRSAIDDIGVFDERLGAGAPFPSAEDNDFGFRLLEAGYRIIYVPQAVLYHRAWRAERDYLRLRWNYGVGRGAVYAKHLSLRDRYMLRRIIDDTKAHIFLFLGRFRHERRRAYGDLALIAGILFGVVKWLLTQRKTR